MLLVSSLPCLRCHAAAVGRLGDQAVERFERVHPLGQEVPRLELGGQVSGAVSLHHINHGNEDGHAQERSPDACHDPPARQREAQHQRGQEQEAEEKVQDREPAVLGSALAQDTRHPYRQTHEGERIPQQNAEDVEEEVTQSNLWREDKEIQGRILWISYCHCERRQVMTALRWHWVIFPPKKLKLASVLMQDLISCIEMRSLSTYAKIEGAIIKQKI